MKKNEFLLIAAVAIGIYILTKNKKDKSENKASATAGAARALVADQINKITFVPDTTTDKDLYNKDQNLCL